MIDRERLRELLIERSKEAGVYSDTPEFAKHLEHEVVDYLTDLDSDHEREINQQIQLIRQHNIMLRRVPYEGYPYVA